MLALDLDDTLLRSDLTISYRTRHVIRRAQEAGIVMVLTSGRIPASIGHFSRILGLHKHSGYIICNNGAMIQESHTGTIVNEVRLDVETALSVYELAEAEGFPVQIYEYDIMYESRTKEDFRARAGGGCHKLLIPGDPMLLVPLESIIRTYLGENITLFTSKPYYLEILPVKTDKGTALEKVAGIMGIKPEEVLAIGDSMNDEAMIRWAGMGVAMVNGDERIKSIADLVTEKDNDNDGVAEVIEKYVLGKNG